MESDRSRQSHSSPLREKSPSRLDPPHRPQPVPVLFRLQNVQRVPAAAPEAVAATEQFFASGMPAPVEDSRRTRMPSPPPPAAAPAELASLPRSPAASRPGVGAASHLPAPTVAGGAQPSAVTVTVCGPPPLFRRALHGRRRRGLAMNIAERGPLGAVASTASGPQPE